MVILLGCLFSVVLMFCVVFSNGRKDPEFRIACNRNGEFIPQVKFPFNFVDGFSIWEDIIPGIAYKEIDEAVKIIDIEKEKYNKNIIVTIVPGIF